MKKKLLLAAMLSCMLMFSSLFMISASAVTTTCDTYDGSNVEYQNYWTWSYPVQSYLTESPSGGLMRVQGGAVSGKVLIEYYDGSYNILSSKTISTGLPIFGAFYETDSNYYILSGQTNYDEDDSVEVYRITKYDKNWKVISSCGLYGANTYIPFDAGSARMTDDSGYLLIRTCHEMYASSDGLHHQANVTIQVDMDSMTITDSYYDVMNSSYGYVSHSFNQFIRTEDDHIIAVDHGDAYPRSIALIKYSTDFTTGSFTPDWGSFCTVVNMLSFPGAAGNNTTGASVGGFEISDDAYIVVGSYAGDDNYSSYSATRNIFVSSLAKNSDTPEFKWITSYTSGSASTPQLVKLSDNSFLLMWSYNEKVYYTKLDGNGDQVGSTYSMTGALSDCVPTVYNGKLVWYTWDYETVTFYSINTSSLSSSSKTVIENGHKFTTKNTAGSSKATQTCSQCGLTQTITVPTDFTMWWRENADSGYYWSSYSTTYHPGDTLDVWADITQTVDNYDLVFEISDTSVASLDSTDYSGMRRITMNKAGTFTLKVYPRYNTTAAKTYTFTVKHDYTSKVTKAATCTATGVRTYTCSTCGDSYTATIAKTAHTYTKKTVAATYAAQGYTLYTCSVCGDSYKGNYTAKKTVATVSAKSDFTCTTSAIRINWNKVADASGYKIFRYNDSTGKWDLAGKVNNNTTFNFLDSGLKAGKTYQYQVQAFVNYNGTYYYGSNSNTVTAITKTAAPVPTAAYTCTSSAIRVNWNKVEGASGYKIFRYDTKTKSWVLVGKVLNNTTFNFLDKNGLAAGTSYQYQVQAFTKFNNKYYYSAMSKSFTAATKPAATKIIKNTKAASAVRLYWNKVSCTGYKIEQYKDGKWVTIKKVAMGVTEYRVSGLSRNTSYKFRIIPYFRVGDKILYGAPSAVYTATTAK